MRGIRALWTFAVGFLALDAILLGLAAWWGNRPVLFLWATVFALGAGLAAISWRLYRRRIDEVQWAKWALRREVEDLRETLRSVSQDK